MELACTGLFRARWTDQIHDEWIQNLLQNRSDLTQEQLNRTRTLMNRSVPNSLITGYEWMINSLQLPDPNDRHVLAAAIQGRVDAIVTFNLKDFPQSILDTHGIESLHPNEFITDLIDLSPLAVAEAARTCHQRLKNPPTSREEYLQISKPKDSRVPSLSYRNYFIKFIKIPFHDEKLTRYPHYQFW